MPTYRRLYHPGGTYFLTLVTHERRSIFTDALARQALHDAIALTGHDRSFDLVAIVLLPDHVHLVVTLPPGDGDFSIRIGAIKGRFSRRWLMAGGRDSPQSLSRTRQGYRGVWQKRFWEHLVRDEEDLIHCLNYVHYNPVKHGYVKCSHAWQWSSFHRFVRDGRYLPDWCCCCAGERSADPPADILGAEMD